MQPPSRCLFAVNLSYNTTEEDLARFAEPYGPVDSVKVVRDRETGRSKCYGFIYMQSTEAALQVSGVHMMAAVDSVSMPSTVLWFGAVCLSAAFVHQFILYWPRGSNVP